MNNISFTSNIIFVNAKTFENFRTGDYVDFRGQKELNSQDKFIMKLIKKGIYQIVRKPRLDVLKSDEFFTETVRTCTAGGVVDTKTGEAVGFHIYDDLTNLEDAKYILDDIFSRIKNPNRALLIGSKKLKQSIYSPPIFQQLYDGFIKRIRNITIFREHIFPYSESNIHYSAKNDTWTIQSMYRPLTDIKEYDILSEEDLANCFKDVEIAEGDTVSFLQTK